MITSEESVTAAGQLRDQMAQQLVLRDQTDAYLTARSDTVRNIEHTIVELGQIFSQLATMVRFPSSSLRASGRVV